MRIEEQRKRMADVLEKVAHGAVSVEEALNETNAWPSGHWKEQILADAWHTLKHFEIDQDASGKNPKLAQFQRTALLKWATRLRETARAP